ncbi:MAG: prepilin-type N-terminal cleavage/methylation domain-containing protein [Candidatus Niyogibacteria bacterium]|nr:MAG: prepilin-type N-terminal cleavage/methylation domain-containing protein [Candidatus Niyogibacteria bacterium]
MSLIYFVMNKKSGVSLIETVIYVAILAVLIVFTVNTILTMSSVYARARLIRRVAFDSETALERVTREIRLASSVDDGASSFDVNPSRVVLNTIKSFEDPTPEIKEFYLSGSRLAFREGAGAEKFLTSDDTDVSSFVVNKIQTQHSQALKITLIIEASGGKNQISRNFYQTAILKGGY